MGSSAKVFVKRSPEVGDAARPPPLPGGGRARRVLLLLWLVGVVAPWILQVRSFWALVMRHKISLNLVPRTNTTKRIDDLASQCQATGLVVASIYWNLDSVFYYDDTSTSDDAVLCHFVFPQFNAHGMYTIENRKTKSSSSAPKSCANDSYAFSYYFYHGSVGYYSFYTEGEGSYCANNHIAYGVATAMGSSDINFNALAKYEGGSGYHSSYFFGCVGSLWIAYRAVILARSYTSCSSYGRKLDALGEPLSISSAVVYTQQAARIAPHTALNWHRLVMLYLLLEGVMTDMFLLVAFDGYSAKFQYVSLNYNVAGILSLLLEIAENSKIPTPSTLLVVKRVLFNSELALWGELVSATTMASYLSGLNQIHEASGTARVAKAMSYYMWSFISHGLCVFGQTLLILAVRAVGTLTLARYRFGSVKALAMPCCVDSLMGYRYKLATVTGYEYENSGRLCYSKEALKAHGLLKMTDTDGTEFLVYHKIDWLPSARESLSIIGKLTGEHVESYPASDYSGPVSICDRKLGGEAQDAPLSDKMDDLETAHLRTWGVNHSC